VFPSIDYTRLLYTPPGKVLWNESQQINTLSEILFPSGLSDIVGADQASLGVQTSFGTASYEKQ
jgi:hypothetical protein